jgi:hypothetical protein
MNSPHFLARAFVAVCVPLVVFSCNKDEHPQGTGSSTPEVVGCSSVKYQGYTYSITGCSQQGVASFDVTISQNGHTASFHITCSNGCIATATVQGEPPTGEPGMSFTCTQGNFQASGSSWPSGVFWMDDSTFFAIQQLSGSRSSIALLGFERKPSTGTYSFAPASGTGAHFVWAINVDISDSADFNAKTCILDQGSVTIAVTSGTNVSGTFSGSGFYLRNTSQRSTLTGGVFRIPSGLQPRPYPSKVEPALRILRSQLRFEENP